MPDFRWPPPPDREPRRAAIRRSPPQPGRRPPLPAPETALVPTPHGVTLERLVTGAGEPVTVFAHGLGHDIAHTRPFGSAVRGRKVFFQLRGHGRSAAPPGRWSYEDLARDLRAIADLSAATRAVGVSLGAAALCRLLVDSPRRFERLVFFLPAVLDQQRPAGARDRLAGLLAAARDRDVDALTEAVAAELPPAARNTPMGWAYLTGRLDQLLAERFAAGYAALPDEVPVTDLTPLREVTASALVVACAADPLHPVSVARRLAEALPRATLHVYETPGVFWTHRADLRRRVSTFLNE